MKKRIIVLAKQVPDTANIKGNAMKEDGTVNRAVLPAVFNPEDLNALEMALEIKERLKGEVTVVSMGPPAAVEILKMALYMGADRVYLITDRAYAGSDTLVTSLILARAIVCLGGADIILAGRQAIDGDTAQVGPQVAEKLDFDQVTYVSELCEVAPEYVVVKRDGELQIETLRAPLPVLLTITSQANTPRYPSSFKMRKYFRARLSTLWNDDERSSAEEKGWSIPVLTQAELNIDPALCGLKGSPTKVHQIKNISLAGGNLAIYESQDMGIRQLIRDIMKDYVEVEQ